MNREAIERLVHALTTDDLLDVMDLCMRRLRERREQALAQARTQGAAHAVEVSILEVGGKGNENGVNENGGGEGEGGENPQGLGGEVPSSAIRPSFPYLSSELSTVPPLLTDAQMRAKLQALPFIEHGVKPKDQRGMCFAPDSIEVTQAGLALAQSWGWRGDLDWLQITADACVDWGKGKNERKASWIATLRNWIKGTINKGEDLPPSRGRAVPTGGYTNGGASGRSAPVAPLGQPGQPGNRADRLTAAHEQLADFKRALDLREEVGGHAGAQRPYDGRGH